MLRNLVGLNITENAWIGNLVVEGTKPLFRDWGCTGHRGGHTFGAFVPPGKGYGDFHDHFRDEPWLPCTWVNYQVDFDFQFPTNRYRDGYLVGTSVRWYGERFPGQDFTNLTVRASSAIDASVTVTI